MMRGVLARAAFGCAAGAVATYIMDFATEMLYTEDIKRRESEIQSESATAVLARRLLESLELNPTDADVSKLAPLLHWSLGIKSGGVAGVLAGHSSLASGLAVAGAMFAFDNVGLAALKAAPPTSSYPWQTTLRSLIGHVTYAFTFALAYEGLQALAES